MSDYSLGELSRQIANMIRVGEITELDFDDSEAPRVKVEVSGFPSDWLPWSAGRAGASRKWSPPSVGEQVIIVAPYGDLGQAMIIGSLFSASMPAPDTSATRETVAYPDGSTVSHDSETNTLTVTVAGAGNVVVNCQQGTINADESLTFNTPDAHFTGNLKADGDISDGVRSMNGDRGMYNGHTHGGSPPPSLQQ